MPEPVIWPTDGMGSGEEDTNGPGESVSHPTFLQGKPPDVVRPEIRITHNDGDQGDGTDAPPNGESRGV